jgi:hypothetical protein
MNERIRELAEQAVNAIPDHVDFDIPDAFKEKFAELIVRECANLCLDPNHWYEDAAGETFNRVIKEHFGVEE